MLCVSGQGPSLLLQVKCLLVFPKWMLLTFTKLKAFLLYNFLKINFKLILSIHYRLFSWCIDLYITFFYSLVLMMTQILRSIVCDSGMKRFSLVITYLSFPYGLLCLYILGLSLEHCWIVCLFNKSNLIMSTFLLIIDLFEFFVLLYLIPFVLLSPFFSQINLVFKNLLVFF